VFSGVVRVDRGETTELAIAYGLAHRHLGIPTTVGTRFGIASGAKTLTALTVVRAIEDGHLAMDTTARSVLGPDLPLVPDDVTIEHLLAHRSGIGDYLDEDAELDLTAHLMPVPVHELATTEQYLAVLDGHPPKFPAGEQFSYCNGGYVVLALIVERVLGASFHELVAQHVCRPAGMVDTSFPRGDEPAPRIALGYLDADSPRTNVLHLPVRGSGDGGVVSTAEDIHRLWRAFLAGAIVGDAWVAEMVRPRSSVVSGMRYGLGVWRSATGEGIVLEGMDAGVSFRSEHQPASGVNATVISNTTDGAWPIARLLEVAAS
jgi:CubicO group peptidase (beta-lactamase class C family)